ncbi:MULTISPECIES: SusC/RagA family TonB-linked outer membrane protein [Larkinella]|uniref:TonB-dependent receptor n=1 Tax=Larkinella punicea TaxID=2315727 RepID=A0A368JDF4_9BACT|nr:TonB-dependent receptor [Larkinella punicea]RCR65699.1 TonB-dependent receptor [Larkinella punicea]
MMDHFIRFNHERKEVNGPRQYRVFQVRKKALLPAFLLSFAFILSLGFSQAFAQERTVTGTVTSSEDKVSLPGVTVQIKGTTRGTNTDADGKYSLTNVPDNATLVFSFIGLQNQEIAVGNRTVVDAVLTSDTKSLEEVVVVGYGTAKRKDLTGSVQQVTAKEFNPGIVPNPLQAIQGKVAGLVITMPSGDPNQAPTVRLRGYTSLAGGSDPLYVVDGVIGVPIQTVSPTDIESMDVLKDASAAAIYGSRAANGVIIVTTKRGKSGKTTITFNNYIGVETISNQLDLLDGPGYRAAVSTLKGDSTLSLDRLRFPAGNYNTDWVKEITRMGVTTNHDLAISGGSPAFSYRGSLNYIGRDGIIKNTGFDRVTARINLDQKALDNRLNIQYNLSVTNTNSKLNDDAIIARAVTFLPTLPITDPTGANNVGGYYEVGGSFDLFNPVAMLNNQRFDQQKRLLIGGVNLRYEIIDGLTLGVNGAFQNENTDESRSRDRSIKAFQTTNGEAYRKMDQVNNKLLELTATYTKAFGQNNSNFNVLGGYSYQNIVYDGFQARNAQFLTNTLSYDNLGLGAGTLLSPASNYATSYRNATTLASFFARATVNMNDKYNLTATVRRDGSSKFGANNKWGLFPSVGAGWTLTNEDFFPKSTTLNYLKLRVGWGQTGNSEGLKPYQSLQLYGQKGTYYDGGVADFLPGYGITQNANPNLKWEVLTTSNLGLDFQLLNGRFSGTLEFYSKTTKDMLYRYSVPADGVKYFTNFIWANVGTMRNRGIELSFGGDLIQKENFSWTSRIVGAYNKNTIVNLKSDEFDSGLIRFNAFGGRGLSDVFASYLWPGRPLGEFNNVPTFVDYTADGKVLLKPGTGDQPTTSVSDADAAAGIASQNPVAQGNPQPFLTGSFINTFTYKGFDLNFQIRGSFGNKILNNLRSNLLIPGSILETNMLQGVADLPSGYSTNVLSTYWLENGTYARLDNWQIGYNIRTGGKYLSAARVYLGGNNLFTLTSYKGVDPELQVKADLQNESQAPNNIGMDFSNIYPKTRSFQLGLNLTF